MHILIIPSGYPTEDAPIRSIFFKEQAIALKEAGHEIGVIYSETRRITGINIERFKKNHFQVSCELESGINTIRLHGWNILMMRNSLGINLWIKQTINLFEKYIKKYGMPDIIHVHCGLYGGMAAKMIKEKYNIPYVVTEHSSNVLNHLLNDYHKKLIKTVYDNANYLISVGEKLKLEMSKYTNNNIIVIPNIVNTDKFIVKSKKEEDNGIFRFISVSFLNSDKMIDLTIKAFNNEFKGNKEFQLYIAGDGNEEKFLKELVTNLGINDQVKFVGRINRVDLPDFLSSGDCFVLPSKYETFGVAYIEALACGLPIITTRCGGPEDFYTNDIGYIIDVGDKEALSKAMKEIVLNRNRFNSDKISNYIKNRFSKEIIIKKLEYVYGIVVE